MAALLERPVMTPRKLNLFDQLREEMDRMFDFPTPRFGVARWREMAFVPALEIEEKENKLFVKVDLPGMKKEAVKVEVAPEGLTITGERQEEKENKLFVKVDLPGMKKEAVKVEVAPEGLTIRGERQEEKEEKKEGYFRTERLYGAFERFVPLPDGAVLDKAAAEFKDGVLTVTVPLGAVTKPEVKTLPIV